MFFKSTTKDFRLMQWQSLLTTLVAQSNQAGEEFEASFKYVPNGEVLIQIVLGKKTQANVNLLDLMAGLGAGLDKSVTREVYEFVSGEFNASRWGEIEFFCMGIAYRSGEAFRSEVALMPDGRIRLTVDMGPDAKKYSFLEGHIENLGGIKISA